MAPPPSGSRDLAHVTTRPRWTAVKQTTSLERAQRRREFVRQRCRRFGWEPFSVEDTMTVTSQNEDDPATSETDDDVQPGTK